jgi:hypothetical protein
MISSGKQEPIFKKKKNDNKRAYNMPLKPGGIRGDIMMKSPSSP